MDWQGLTELKRRLFYLIAALVVYRVGAHIPVPGLDPNRLATVFSDSHTGILGLVNLFSGGALSRLTVFALGIMPYISSSIIIQLLSAASPRLSQLKKEGESGRRILSQYTRYLTVLLASMHGLGMARFLVNQGVALSPSLSFYATTTLTLVTGTLFLMWLGEKITERGLGNGISMIIFSSIVSGLPAAVGNTFEQVRQGLLQPMILIALMAVLVSVILFIVFVERGQRRIAVNYAKRQQGRRVFQAAQSHLPLKVNMAGVLPPIFASALILFPATLAQWLGHSEKMSWLSDIGMALSPGQPLYVILFAAGILFFCFVYTALMFNPKDTAENLKKSGAYIPGIRPGEQTAKYIDKVMGRLTLAGAIYIMSVALLPEFLVLGWQVPFYFGGTSLLIVVVVIMDLVSQVQSHLISRQYEGLMKQGIAKGAFSKRK